MKNALVFAAILLASAGCNSGERIIPDQPTGAAPAGTTSTVADAAVPSAEPDASQQLPPLGEAVLLEQGRLSIKGPADWTRPPRDPKWLIRFEMTAGTPYPAILLPTPEDTDLPDVTKDNADEFARQLRAQLQQELSAQGFKVPEVKPLVLEHFAGAEYSRQAKVQGRNVQLNRLYLVTVQGGRKYTIELHALYGTQATFRPHVLAVAEGLEFHPSDEPAAKDDE